MDEKVVNRIKDISSDSNTLIINIKSKLVFNYVNVFVFLVSGLMVISIYKDLINEWSSIEDFLKLLPLLGAVVFNIGLFGVTLWSLFGKENVLINNKYLQINKTIFGLGRKKRYLLEKVTHINYKYEPNFGVLGRAETQDKSEMNNGSIRFKFESKIINIVDGINNDEAIEILDKLKSFKYLKAEKFELFDFMNI